MKKPKYFSHRMAKAVTYLSIAVAVVIAGCGTVDRIGDWWKSGATEAPRLPPGAIEYLCDANKTFQARFDTATQSAWVRFPDREFRLDAVAGTAAGRYSNGRTTLNTKGDEAFLTEGTAVSYANCKRAAAG